MRRKGCALPEPTGRRRRPTGLRRESEPRSHSSFISVPPGIPGRVLNRQTRYPPPQPALLLGPISLAKIQVRRGTGRTMAFHSGWVLSAVSAR